MRHRRWRGSVLCTLLLLSGIRTGEPADAGEKALASVTGRPSLPGLLAAPRPLQGIGRWQMAFRTPLGRITAIAWSRDGKEIVFSEMGYLRICDAETFETRKVLVGHSQRIQSLDWNAVTNRIVSASLDGSVRIWSADGVPEKVLTGPAAVANFAAWSPDGKWLATAWGDGTVQIFKSDGTPIRTINASDAAINCVAWSPSSNQLVTGDDNQQVKIWNVDGSPVATCPGHLGPVTMATWSHTGKWIATATAGFYSEDNLRYLADVRIWNVDGSKGASYLDEKTVFALQWSPDGRTLASLTEQGELQLRNPAGDLASTRTIQNLGGLMSSPSLAWRPDGKAIAFGGLHRVVTLALESGNIRESNPPPYTLPNYTYADWSPSGDRIALVTARGIEFRRPDGTLAGRLAKPIRSFDGRGQIAWSPDGTRAVVVSRGSPIAANSDGTLAGLPFALSPPVTHVAWNAKTNLFAYAGGNSIHVVKPGGSFNSDFAAKHDIDSLRWNADGTRLAVLYAVKGRTLFALAVYDPNGKTVATLKDLRGEVDACDISPDGNTVLLGYDAGHWEAWDLKDASAPKRTASAHLMGSCTDVSFSPDGSHFVTTGWNGSSKLWRSDGALVRTYYGHPGATYSASFSHDGRRLVTAGWDPTVCIWSTESERAETTIFFRSARGSIVIAADGSLRSGSRSDISAALIFLVERPDGAMELLDYDEFLKRTQPAAR